MELAKANDSGHKTDEGLELLGEGVGHKKMDPMERMQIDFAKEQAEQAKMRAKMKHLHGHDQVDNDPDASANQSWRSKQAIKDKAFTDSFKSELDDAILHKKRAKNNPGHLKTTKQPPR